MNSCLSELRNAIVEGKIDEVKDLLEKTPTIVNSPFDDNRYPLEFAIDGGKDAIAVCLIERSASPELISTSEITILNLACEIASVEVVESLLRTGASKRANADGSTILGTAILRGDSSFVELLLRYGVDPNEPDKSRLLSPIEIACRVGSAAIVRVLLNHGANAKGVSYNAAVARLNKASVAKREDHIIQELLKANNT